MPLYEMTVKAYKTFYVEADSEEDAIEHDQAHREFSRWGDIEYEPDEMSVHKCDSRSEQYARDEQSHLILE